MGLIIRILVVFAGFIASWFVARDALNFEIVQMVVVVILFTIAVAIGAFWPILKNFFKKTVKKRKHLSKK